MKVKIIDISGSHCFDKDSIVTIVTEKNGEFEAVGISRYTGNKITQWLIKEEFEVIPE